MENIKKRKKTFLWLFIASTSIFTVLVLSHYSQVPDQMPTDQMPTDKVPTDKVPIGSKNPDYDLDSHDDMTPKTAQKESNDTPRFSITDLVAIGSFFTSTGSLIGILSTTMLNWKEDKREEKERELNLKKQELEIRKMSKELEKLEEQNKDKQ